MTAPTLQILTLSHIKTITNYPYHLFNHQSNNHSKDNKHTEQDFSLNTSPIISMVISFSNSWINGRFSTNKRFWENYFKDNSLNIGHLSTFFRSTRSNHLEKTGSTRSFHRMNVKKHYQILFFHFHLKVKHQKKDSEVQLLPNFRISPNLSLKNQCKIL